MINFSLDFSLNKSFLLISFSYSSEINTGYSSPAESKRAIFLSWNNDESGYLILNPSVFILIPEGIAILDIFERRKDFPVLAFPITPILITFLFLLFW